MTRSWIDALTTCPTCHIARRTEQAANACRLAHITAAHGVPQYPAPTIPTTPAGFYECCEHCDDEAPCREGYYPDRPDTHMTECEHCETSTGPTLAYLNPRD